MLAVESVLKQTVVRVYVIQDCVCVSLVRGSEYHDLHNFVQLLQTLHKVRPYVDASAQWLFVLKIYFEDHIRKLSFYIFYTVD